MQGQSQDIENAPADKYVLLIDNRKETRILKISQNKNFKWRKTPIPLLKISDHPYFTLFEVGNHQLTPIPRIFEEQAADQEGDQVCAEDNNKEIYTLQEAQKLQIGQIERMKKELKPEQIINELVDNNEQFSKRTAYSKEKYLKKKSRKYMFHIQAEPITLAALHQHHYKDDPKSVAGLRWDMLALALLHGGPFQRVLIAEKGKGILLAGLAGRQVQRVVVAGQRNRKSYSLLQQINAGKQTISKFEFKGWKQIVEKQQLGTFTNLILAGNYDFSSILSNVFPYLSGGSIITFFCISQEPLVAAFKEAIALNCIAVKLYDSWAREYQVLHNRTHPMMYMDGCSGYLLTAIKRGAKQ